MSAQHDPAFPRVEPGITGEPTFVAYGLSVRDYFAAHAPDVPDSFPPLAVRKLEIVEDYGGLKRQRVRTQENYEERMIRWRWHYADLMVAERAK